MNLQKTIMDLRREKGYTQEKLAEMLGISTAAVSKWECGNSYPDITLLPQIAEIFDVSLDYLFSYDTTERKTISEVINEANRLSKELNRDASIALIAKTLARYPNNDRLIFELARHKYIASRYLEEAYIYAERYDSQENGFVYNVYGIMKEAAETEERISSKKNLADTLHSNVSSVYDPIRNSERFKDISEKLGGCSCK